MTETTVINRLRHIFAHFGVPQTLVSDNVPSLIARSIDDWLDRIGCEHLTSAAFHPKSNGLAERMVRSFKEHLRVNRSYDLKRAADRFLMSYRNIPHSITGVSPSLLMFGRDLRTPVTIMQNMGYHKIPLKKEYAHGEIIDQRGKMLMLHQSDGSIVRRHEDQVKLKQHTSNEGKEDKVEENDNNAEEKNVTDENSNEADIGTLPPSSWPRQNTERLSVTSSGIATTRPLRQSKPIKRFIFET